MKPFNAVNFLSLQGWLGWYETFRQQRFPSVLTSLPKSALRLLGLEVLHGLGGVPHAIILDKDRKDFRGVYEATETICELHDLGASAETARKMLECLKTPGSVYGTLYELGHELNGRLHDEMKRRTFFALSVEETKYFEQPRAGWESIIARFPTITIDVEEARKCFALSRYAAAVFHSVQVVEIGLVDLGQFLEVNDPISGWSAVANKLKTVIAKKYDARTEFERKNAEFLEQLQGTVEALKNAWRNKISHARGHLALLTADFNPEITEEILFATRSFMRRLADGLPSSKADA